MITLDTFISEVRIELDIAGLPRNWQPARDSIAIFYYQRFSIDETANKFKYLVKRYEDHVNRNNSEYTTGISSNS